MSISEHACMRAAVFAACAGLAACGEPPPTPRAAATAEPPPAFWTVEAEQGGVRIGRAVRLCVDDRLRSGFASIQPQIGGERCAPESAGANAALLANYKCRIGAQEFGVARRLRWTGPRSFQAGFVVVDLDRSATVYERTLLYRKLGACPAGWRAGEGTDQSGRRVWAAVIPGTDMHYLATPSTAADGGGR